MKNLTLKTATRSTSDILIDINLSLFPDNVINSVSSLLYSLKLQKNVALSNPNSDSVIVIFFDEMSLKTAYRSILGRILETQNPDTFVYIQEELSKIKSVNTGNPDELKNPNLISLSVLYSGETFCNLSLPSDKSFMKSTVAKVTSFLESCGHIEIPFPDFNDDEISISFIDLKDLVSFGLFVAYDLL